MPKSPRKAEASPSIGPITRSDLIAALNEDLAREYQAIIAYVQYSQVIKGAEFMHIARELETHAAEELSHAITIAKQIDYLGGTPTVVAKPVKTSDDPKVMLRADLENERQRRNEGSDQCSEHIREILLQEQDHLSELASALGIDPPNPGMAD